MQDRKLFRPLNSGLTIVKPGFSLVKPFTINLPSPQPQPPTPTSASLISPFNFNPLVTLTSTVSSIIVSTLTVAQFQSCIGSAQFITNVGTPATTLTAVCSRRRRETAQIVDALVEATPVLP